MTGLRNKVFVVGLGLILSPVFLFAIAQDTKVAYANNVVLVPAYELNQREVEFLAKTMWGEARNQGDEGMLAVGFVILNRVGTKKRWNTVEDVVLSRKQFSVWNPDDLNYNKLLKLKNDREYLRARKLAEGLLRNHYTDITQQATHYHAKRIRPYWAKKLKKTVEIGDHVFYKD